MKRRVWGAVALASTVGALTLVGCGARSTDGLTATADAGASDGSVGEAGSSIGKPCGKNGFSCLGDAYCELAPKGSCNVQSEGVCRARPAQCPTSCAGVCGCDGHAYCNECEAQRAGTDVAAAGACLPGGGEYSAFALVTNLERFILFKADPSRDVCLRLTVARVNQSQYQIQTPQFWGVERVDITHRASDCAITSAGYPKTPEGTVLDAAGGQGVIQFLDGDAGQPRPCGLFVHARIAFDNTGQPWAPVSEPLDVDNLDVAGECQ